MQHQTVTGAPEQGAAKEDLRTQRGWLAIAGEAGGTLKFPEQIEQQQDAAEGGFGGEELLQTEIIRGQIVL